MKRPGFLQYKCRRCHQIFKGGHSPDAQTTVIRVMAEGKHYEPGATVGEQKPHYCKQHLAGIGIGDLIGAIYDESKPTDD